MSLAVYVTIASPKVDLGWIASVAARVPEPALLLETAGVIFAFNLINRIADARRVRLELRLLREWKPIRGWVERRLASLAGLAYDLSFQYQPCHSRAELQDRLGVVLERLGAASVPEIFNWLSRSPAVLEGVLEMLEASVTGAGLRFDLLREAAVIAVASRAMPGSGLSRAAEQWSPAVTALLSSAAAPADAPDLVSACRRYCWRVANAAYKITEERIRQISALGLSDAEILDLSLTTAAFSALAIIEPIGAALRTGETPT